MKKEESYLEQVFETENVLVKLPSRPLIFWLFLVAVFYLLRYNEAQGTVFCIFLTSSILLGNSISWSRHYRMKNILSTFSLLVSSLFFIREIWLYITKEIGYIKIEFILFFIVLAGITFVGYEFYRRSLIAKSLQREFIFSIRNKDKLSRVSVKIIGIAFVFLGIFICYIAGVGGMVLVFIGGLIVFSSEGTDIDTRSKRIKFYRLYFGFKRGRWENYNDSSYLSILVSLKSDIRKFRPAEYTDGSILRAHLFIMDGESSRKVLLYRFNKKELPFKEAQELADKMGVKLEKGNNSKND